MTVTRRQKEFVQETWRQVVPISETAAGLFYGRLFEIAPDLETLFPAEERAMQEQGRKLMQVITLAVHGLDQLDDLVPAVEDLGRRHATYGVRDENYETVGDALLWTLEQGLGAGLHPGGQGCLGGDLHAAGRRHEKRRESGSSLGDLGMFERARVNDQRSGAFGIPLPPGKGERQT